MRKPNSKVNDKSLPTAEKQKVRFILANIQKQIKANTTLKMQLDLINANPAITKDIKGLINHEYSKTRIAQ